MIVLFLTGTRAKEFTRLCVLARRLSEKYPEVTVVFLGKSKIFGTNQNLKIFNQVVFSQYKTFLRQAGVIITHAGFGSIFDILQYAQVSPIIVPRQYSLGEHVNNHQEDFFLYLEKIKPSRQHFSDMVGRHIDSVRRAIQKY